MILYAWTEASEQFDRVQKIWKRGRLLVQMNYAEEDYSDINTEFAELEAAIEMKDLNSTIRSVKQIIEHKNNFERIIPEP